MACSSLAQPANQTDRLREFRRRAAAFNGVITVPQFETTTNEIRYALRQTIIVRLHRVSAQWPME